MNLNHTAWQPGKRSRTVAIVGAGFSGTAVAVRLLRSPPAGTCRIVLIERSARFGPGLAYAGQYPAALLNVPAGRMSLDEHAPADFLDYLRSFDFCAGPDDFVPREVYGDYLETRLLEAARKTPSRVQLVRMQGSVNAVARVMHDGIWNVEIDDGRAVLADEVVLAFGHFAPRTPDALAPLLGSGLYTADPWMQTYIRDASNRVLLIGTGLTMADVACHLMRQTDPPAEIIAVSRRGLLPHTRPDHAAQRRLPFDSSSQLRGSSVRDIVSRTRRFANRVECSGGDWRDAINALREHVPELWERLDDRERARFVRHVQPYWDIHRHQLPPRIGRALKSWIDEGRLRVLPARLLSAQAVSGKVVVEYQARGAGDSERVTVDRIVNCSGPDYHPCRVNSSLVRSLLTAGYLTPDATGSGLQVDSTGRLIHRNGRPVEGLHYLGPWLRARDFEATAVPELRVLASALAQSLRCRASGAARHAFVPTGVHPQGMRSGQIFSR
jgi:uncharacterized NAD(P)/FAD-binding protein YdhS